MKTILPKLYRLDKPAQPDAFGTAESPLGTLLAKWQGDYLVSVSLISEKIDFPGLKRDDARVAQLKDALFSNEAWSGVFKAPIKAGVYATDFVFNVLEAMNEIPSGETMTYAGLAATSGNIGAARAAGSVCSKNPLLFVLPCHRVVSASGKIGNYLYGTAMKSHLLQAEDTKLAS